MLWQFVDEIVDVKNYKYYFNQTRNKDQLKTFAEREVVFIVCLYYFRMMLNIMKLLKFCTSVQVMPTFIFYNHLIKLNMASGAEKG